MMTRLASLVYAISLLFLSPLCLADVAVATEDSLESSTSADGEATTSTADDALDTNQASLNDNGKEVLEDTAAAVDETRATEPTQTTDNLRDNRAIDGDKNGSTAGSSSPSPNKRMWGSVPNSASTTADAGATGAASSSSSQSHTKTESNSDNASQHQQAPPPLSFIPKAKTQHPPPEGFVISARVYIDPVDKLAHLDEDAVTLPYWDCGITGSTTSPLPVKDLAFRHSVTPTTPWTGTDGKHPLLVVALSPLIIETNSGESKTVQAGQVILLDDVIMEGHKLLPLPHQELQVLFLTLPQTHYHPGKDRVSLYTSGRASQHPCPVPDEPGSTTKVQRRPFLTATNIRRGLFGMVGLSLSALAADFLSKTVPLWLAVGVGGTCLVAGGTSLTVTIGEWVVANLEYTLEQRRLAPEAGEPSRATVPDLDDKLEDR